MEPGRRRAGRRPPGCVRRPGGRTTEESRPPLRLLSGSGGRGQGGDENAKRPARPNGGRTGRKHHRDGGHRRFFENEVNALRRGESWELPAGYANAA